ncbi:MAG: alpha/beta hydrolase [Clostridia bacterium]|nr:alpha/beta hydrolase [Clostridia bacterium]
MEFVSRGVRMYYEVSGEAGEPLLLLHGWGGKAESFLPVARDFKRTHVVYAVDFPGHGKSSEPDAPWSVTEYMEFIHAFLREKGIKRTDIIAHSFGGRVAILLAATYPGLVGKMVLTGAAGLPPKKTGKKTVKSRVYRLLRGVALSGAARAVLGEERTALWQEALVQRFGSRDYRALAPSMRQTFNRVIAQDLTDCLPKIKAPTLLIWGEDDAETPLWMGKLMEERIPDAGLVSWPGCGHFAYLDRYGDFRVVVERFLG